eukprot:3661477-Amphidinium_carterae.1
MACSGAPASISSWTWRERETRSCATLSPARMWVGHHRHSALTHQHYVAPVCSSPASCIPKRTSASFATMSKA